MPSLPVSTRDLLWALVIGQVSKRYRGRLTVLVIGGNMVLGLALLYRLAGLSKKKEPGKTKLRAAFLRAGARQAPHPAVARSRRGPASFRLKD